MQPFHDYETIVVDDGSTGDSAIIAESFGVSARVLKQANAGLGTVRSLGVMQAKGQYVTFLDSDDIWFPWTLAIFNAVLVSHSDGQIPFMAGTQVDVVYPSQAERIEQEPLRIQVYRDNLATSRERFWIGTPSVRIRTESMIHVGVFPSLRINAEDSATWLRLDIEPGFVHVQSPKVFAYFRHSMGQTGCSCLTTEGTKYLIGQERAGQFSGVLLRRRERLRTFSQHVRSVIVQLARDCQPASVLQLFIPSLC